MPGPADQVNEMAARLKAFGVMMRLGHDLFNAADFSTAAVMAVNNARPVVGFRSSSLLRIQDRHADVLSQYAQTMANVHSHQAVLQRDLIEIAEDANKLTDVIEVSTANADEFGDGSVVRELCPDNISLLLVPLKAPAFLNEPAFRLIWLLEFENKIPAYAMTSAKLLSASYAEALYCQAVGGSRVKRLRGRGLFSLKKIFWIVLLVVTIGVMFFRIPEKVNAEFELKAPEITTVYACFDGPIAKCNKPDGSFWKDGDEVKTGDVIARYDTSQLEFRLAAADAAVRETEAELKLKETASFTDRERLGEVKLLEARLDSAKVAVAEAKWYLEHASLKSPCSGVLQLTDQRAEALIGKAVRTGDKLFDILGGKGMDVKVPVNERESSILLQKPEKITLFLHTSPDTPIVASVREISPAPELTEQRTYCYNLIAELPPEYSAGEKYRYGMRGIAKIEGRKVSIGYFLFKSVILYFRGI